MTRIVFNSRYAILPRTGKMPQYEEKAVKNEPMLFSSSLGHAMCCGGPITKEFIMRIPVAIRTRPDFILDTRVHMLMKGWYPCIPGWHLDDIPRTRDDGQPDHANPIYRAEHFMCLIGDCSVTSFINGKIELDEPEDGSGLTTYQVWHDEIESRLQRNPEFEVSAPVGELVYFNSESFHKGNPATKNGWRWFGRASWNTERKHANEIRKQVQVYLPALTEGW